MTASWNATSVPTDAAAQPSLRVLAAAASELASVEREERALIVRARMERQMVTKLRGQVRRRLGIEVDPVEVSIAYERQTTTTCLHDTAQTTIVALAVLDGIAFSVWSWLHRLQQGISEDHGLQARLYCTTCLEAIGAPVDVEGLAHMAHIFRMAEAASCSCGGRAVAA